MREKIIKIIKTQLLVAILLCIICPLPCLYCMYSMFKSLPDSVDVNNVDIGSGWVYAVCFAIGLVVIEDAVKEYLK